MRGAFYNDNDAYAARWLANLVSAGYLSSGDVDARSILDIDPADLAGYSQCHFFAGIGGWPLALALAGWPEDREVWTGSCPCQPLSSAGQRRGHADERHLWPAFQRLIAQRRPATVFGEQVASKDGREWLAGVRADLEHLGYAVGAADLPAAGVGAPHIRQRLFWVAHAERGDERGERRRQLLRPAENPQALGGGASAQLERGSNPGGVADAQHAERRTQQQHRDDVLDGNDARRQETHGQPGACGEVRGLGNSREPRLEERRGNGQLPQSAGGTPEGQAALGTNPWSDAVWLPCLDGKARRTQPGLFPLAPRLPESLGRLRAIENEVLSYATSEIDTDQTVRMVRQILYERAHRQGCATRMCVQFHAQEILLDLLLSVAPTRHKSANDSSFAETGDEARRRMLRVLRSDAGTCCPSCRRQSNEQRDEQPSDALHLLPFVLARSAQAYWQAATEANAVDNRVGRLRAYGNAITPQAAATFIQAFLDSNLKG